MPVCIAGLCLVIGCSQQLAAVLYTSHSWLQLFNAGGITCTFTFALTT